MNAHAIAESVVGPIDWQDTFSGYCRCPGADLHTCPDGKRDARVNIDGAPTIHCFHSSCTAPVEKANLELRRAMAKGTATPYKPTPQELQAKFRREQEKRNAESVKLRAQTSREEIFSRFCWSPAAMRETSPFRLFDEHYDDWQFLLTLFPLDAVVWIGDVKDSCNDDADQVRKAACARHFRPMRDWLNEPEAPANFTCPSTFKPLSHSRSNENVVASPFLVVESDTLTKDQIGAVFLWMRKFMRLRAVVDTAGKSLHGWFDRPDTSIERELRTILPELGCDPALFKLSQPCRLPGAKRADKGDKFQTLLYLDNGGAR